MWRPLRTPIFRQRLVADVVSDLGAFTQGVGSAWLMVSIGAGPLFVALTHAASIASVLPLRATGDSSTVHTACGALCWSYAERRSWLFSVQLRAMRLGSGPRNRVHRTSSRNVNTSGSSEAWYRARFGTERSRVRIPPSRRLKPTGEHPVRTGVRCRPSRLPSKSVSRTLIRRLTLMASGAIVTGDVGSATYASFAGHGLGLLSGRCVDRSADCSLL